MGKAALLQYMIILTENSQGTAAQSVGLPKEDIGIEQQLYEIVRGKIFAPNCLS